MAAIDNTLAVRDVAAQLMKRGNFASKNPGVMYVYQLVDVDGSVTVAPLLDKRASRDAAPKTTAPLI